MSSVELCSQPVSLFRGPDSSLWGREWARLSPLPVCPTWWPSGKSQIDLLYSGSHEWLISDSFLLEDFYFFPLPFLLLWARATSSHIYVQNSSPSCYHTGPPKMLPILSLFNVALLCGSLLLLIPLTCISGPPKDGKIYILFNSQVSPWLDKAVPHRY